MLSKYGCTSTIFKPFDMDQIMKVLEKIRALDNTVIQNKKTR